ncbi:MAG TPA: hypothetical protein VF707_04575 [Ardenticatenaceae bacterium]|jgi:hypothetical protein
MYSWEESAAVQYLEAVRHQATVSRLACEARAVLAPSQSFYHPALAELGRLLVVVGARLQAQYGIHNPATS